MLTVFSRVHQGENQSKQHCTIITTLRRLRIEYSVDRTHTNMPMNVKWGDTLERVDGHIECWMIGTRERFI